MNDALFVSTGDVSAVLTCYDAIAEVTFYPGDDVDHHQLGTTFAPELFRTVSAHFAAHGARLHLIRYRGDLAPIVIGDLAPFGVPILPTP